MQVWDYDIQSCFPSIAKGLIDITDAEWLHSNKYQKDANYGFCEGRVTIYPHVKVHPIIYTDDNGRLSTPVGSWNTYLCKCEIDFINKWNIGYFEIFSGWWCFCKNPNKRPLENVANRLLKYKESKNEVVRLLAKRMSVGGLYGKFLEEHKDKFGKYFNSVYGATISSEARLEVAEFIYRNHAESSLIHVSVDGVLLDEPITEAYESTNKNIKWKLSETGECLCVSSGQLFFKHKTPQGISYSEIMQLIKDNPDDSAYVKTRKRRLTLGKAIAMKKLELLGTEVDLSTTINLNTVERERQFKSLPESGADLISNVYISRPYKVDEG